MIERPFAKLLKDYRKNNNLTQKELATILDVTKSTIVAYEKGTTDPSVIVLYKAAKNLNFSIDELFKLSPPSLHITDTHLKYAPKKKKEKTKPDKIVKNDFIILKDLILKNRRTFEELTMSKKRTDRMLEELTASKKRTDKMFEELTTSKKRTDRMLEELTMSKKRTDLIYTELKRAINRSTQSEDMFLDVSSKLLKLLDENNIDDLSILNGLNPLNNNEHLATLESNTDNIINESASDKDEYFDYSNFLTSHTDIHNNIEYTSVPLIGYVAAGNPRDAIEQIENYYSIPSDKLDTNEQYFLLRVNGDSMNKLYENNDIILVRKQSCADNGKLVIALVNDCEATFKRYHNCNNIITLQPESTNPIHTIQEYSTDKVTILGIVLGSLREYVE